MYTEIEKLYGEIYSISKERRWTDNPFGFLKFDEYEGLLEIDLLFLDKKIRDECWGLLENSSDEEFYEQICLWIMEEIRNKFYFKRTQFSHIRFRFLGLLTRIVSMEVKRMIFEYKIKEDGEIFQTK